MDNAHIEPTHLKKGLPLSADHFLNLVLFLPSALEYCLDVEKLNLSAIRTVRVLRPLRAINRIPSGFILKQIRDIRIFTFFSRKGMRILVMLLLDTLPMLGNVLLLCFFVFFIFGIVGVQLWAGCLLIPRVSSLISFIKNLSIIHSIACYISHSLAPLIKTNSNISCAGLLRQRCYINETYQRHLIGLEGFQE